MQEGHLKVVEFLFEKGAKIDQADFVGVTPLWIASQVCILLLLLHNLSFFEYLHLMLPSGGSFESCRISVRERRQS